MGLAPVLVDLIFETIETIREQGITSCWSSRTRSLRSRSPTTPTCWSPAASSWRAPAADLANNDEVAQAYLGGASLERHATTSRRLPKGSRV